MKQTKDIIWSANFDDGPLSRSRLPSFLATNRAPFYVLRERAESLLLCKVEPLNLKSFSNLYFSRFYRRVIAKAGTSIGKVIFEFLPFFAKHV